MTICVNFFHKVKVQGSFDLWGCIYLYLAFAYRYDYILIFVRVDHNLYVTQSKKKKKRKKAIEVTLLTSHLHTVLKPQPFSIIQITLKPILSRLQSLTNFVQNFEAEAIEFGPKASKKTQPSLAPSKFKAPLSLHQKTKPLSNVSAKSYPRLFSTIPDPPGHSEKNIPIRGKGPELTARSPPTCPAPIPPPSHLAIHGR